MAAGSVGSAASKAVTRDDVARYAGVSSAVVSYVVNNGPRPVAPATAARVREAIDILGYRPNAAREPSRLGSAGLLGLVVPDSSNPFFAEFALEIEKWPPSAAWRCSSNANSDVGIESRLLVDLVGTAGRRADRLRCGRTARPPGQRLPARRPRRCTSTAPCRYRAHTLGADASTAPCRRSSICSTSTITTRVGPGHRVGDADRPRRARGRLAEALRGRRPTRRTAGPSPVHQRTAATSQVCVCSGHVRT